MKKIIVFVLILVLFSCNFSNTPRDRVEEYLSSYNSLSDAVVLDIDTKVAGEDLSKENKEIYKKVLLRQFENMKYEIKDESISGDKATVLVKITVFDLYRADKESNMYMNENQSEFYNVNNLFDDDLYNEYRLKKMLEASDKIEYEVKFYLNKKDDKWTLIEPNRDVLEKMHGLYNYENN